MKELNKSLIKEFLLDVYKVDTNTFDYKLLDQTIRIICLDHYCSIEFKIYDLNIWLRKYKIGKIYGKIKTT
jgi:hypothetical protein